MTQSNLNQYAPPTAHVADIAGSSGYAELNFFSAKGRIGRLRYLAYAAGASVLFNVATTAIGVAMPGSIAFTVVSLVGLVALVWFSVLCAIKRCHDMNISGWWTLTSFIPIIALAWVFWPGAKGDNRFGPPPPPNTLGVRILGLLLPVVFFVGILAAVAIPQYKQYTDRARAAQMPAPR
ncbi:MAG: DUF805 domain-containing protein [Pelomonas sp.]|nr:DUF805 domain-containing protein [Roseateles sp.]